MEVIVWKYMFLVLLGLFVNGQYNSQNTTTKSENKEVQEQIKSKQESNTDHPLESLKKEKHDRDYFLPPVFPHHEEEEEDEHYSEYDYETKETNYKDSADVTNHHDHIAADDKLPIHTLKDNLPMFLLEPENTYVLKNKPASLKCRAANALEVYFKCNGLKTQAMNFEFVDPQTGVRIIEGEYQVSREQVEEYFGADKYQCLCVAWTSQGHIRSQPATIELAYIKKHFTTAPQSQLVKLNSPVTFRCEPPPAAPYPSTYWLKNGAPVVADDNVQITKEGELLVKQVSLLDMANYTCVAENLAGKRISDPALLTVFVNGGWTPWSSWTECYCSGEGGGRQQRAGRRRERTCTAPRPLNGGQPCVGPSVQKSTDCMDCDLDLYVDTLDELSDVSDLLTGSRARWSQWSEWSHCDTDCLKTRRRRCLTNVVTDCPGKEYQVAQCQLCVRTSKSDIGASYLPLLITLSIAFLIFIVVSILGIKYMKIKMAENSPYAKPPPGSNYFGNVIKRRLTNQPDLTIHEEFQTMESRRTQRHMSTSTNPRLEHLYEVPQLASGYISPLDHEMRPEVRTSDPTLSVCQDGSQRSDSSCFLSSGSSYNESIEMSPSLKNNFSITSKTSKLPHLETATSKLVTGDGDWIRLDKCGVNLFIPDGVIDKGEEMFSVECMDEDYIRPLLQDGQSQLSPVVRCGPKNFHFRKGVVLCFPHHASLNNTNWLFSILQKADEGNSNCREWRKVLTVGQETPGTPLFAQVDPSKVYIVCEFLSDFVLVGKSFTGLDCKLLKLALFVGKRSDGYYSLKIYVFNDTPFGFYQCVESEKRSGSLLCEPKTIAFQENCSDLCFNIREVGQGWLIPSGAKYQELPYSHVWTMNHPACCTFVLHQTDAINCLELNLTIYQKEKQSNSVNFNLKTNDVNSNFTKRFSSSSVDTGYAVNILENPFNYSSLSKREGRYDFVYKSCSVKSNFSVDNNFRTNTLTKSDRIILCKLLDSPSPKGNDWRLMAEKLKLSSFYYYFSNTCSPTDNILNLWLCRNNDMNMILHLARIFREMSRIDCATVVERRCFQN